MKTETSELIRMMQQQFYEEMKSEFISLGDSSRRYTLRQKQYAFNAIDEYGVRAAARILAMPRRTLQRWCRQYGIYVKRCPAWVFEWAERRRRKREFWRRRGYF